MFGSHPRPSCKGKPVTGRYGTPIPLEVFREGVRYTIKELNQVNPTEFDAIIIPGNFFPDRLRIIKEAYKEGKIIAAICHGPQVLISAGIVKGRKCTSYAAIKDENIIISRVPDDLPEFCRLIIESLA